MSAPSGPPNPFKALRPYDPGEALFGRDGDLSLVLDRVLSARTTLLFAGSGVGKTSFLNAKLIPYLERRRYLVCAHIRWAGDKPLAAVMASMAEALARRNPAAPAPGPSVTEEASLVALCRTSPGRTALVLDQFEEVFQYHRDTSYFESFVDALAELINAPAPEVRVVFCMREEFLGELSAFDNKIPDLFNNYYRLKNPTAPQASDIIGDTAAIVGVKCDPDGLRRLVNDLRAVHIGVAPAAGAEASGSRRERHYVPPPYLQIACYRLWPKQSSEASPESEAPRFLAGYVDGHAQREVEGYCDEKLQGLPPRQQDLACDAFEFLMTKQGAKMAYELSNLAQHMKVDSGELEETLTALSHLDVRLLRRSAAPDGSLWFELYHDMYAPFIFEWKERRRRLREERQRQQERERVAHAKAAAVRAWRRSLRRRVAVGGVLLVLGLASIPIVQFRRDLATLDDPKTPYAVAARTYDSLRSGPFAFAPLVTAQAERKWAGSWDRLANQAKAERRTDDELLLRLKSLAIVESEVQRQHVRRLIGGDYRYLQATYRASGSIQKLAYSSNGTVLASTVDGAVQQWSIDSGRPVGDLVPLQGARRVLAFSPDARYALAVVNVLIDPAKAGEALALLNTVNGDRVKLIPLHADQQPSAVIATFANGRAAALTVGKKTVSVISVPDGAQIGGPLQHDADVVAVAFAPNGSVVATATDDGVIAVWEIRAAIPGAAIRPSRRWTLADGGHRRTPADKRITMLLFRPDGHGLLTATREGVQVWRVQSGAPIAGRWLPTPGVVVAAFRPNSGELLIATVSSALEVWNVDTGLRVGVASVAEGVPPLGVNAFAVSPDGAHVLTTAQDGVIRRWSPELERRVEFEEGTAPIAWSEKVQEWQDRLALVVGVDDGRPVAKYSLDERLGSEVATPRSSDGKTSPHLAEGGREEQPRRGR